jgi:hypothetical protein
VQATDYRKARVDYGVRPHPADEVIERMVWLMDNSIPLAGGIRIGLDPVIGLIPGLGDILAGVVSAVIVLQAQRAGIPRSTLLRMVANVGIDTVVGSIPFAGDLFDFAFRANTKNLALYRASRAGVHDPRRDTAFLILLFLALGIIVALPILLLLWAMQRLF